MNRVLVLGLLLFVLSHCESYEQKRSSNEKAIPGGYLRRLTNIFYNKLKEKLTNDYSAQAQSRFKRQQQQQQRFNCTSQSDCIPPDFQDVYIPPWLIDCNDGFCNCSADCFVRSNDTCVLKQCHGYNPFDDPEVCVDYRKSQKTALLLSVFLSATGAANFYIRQYVLAGVQLGLLMLTIVLVCCLVCVPCCVFLCFEDEFEDMTDSICFLMFTLCSLLLGLCLIMAMVIWWLADLTYFVQNARVDGVNDCTLRADL